MSQQNIELVQGGYAAFGRGDINAFLATLDENVDWKTPGGPDVPTAGQRRGRQAVGEFFRTLSEMVDLEHFEPQTFIADGEYVVVLGADRFKIKGGSGKSVSEPWCHVFTIRDGKIVAFQEFADMTTIAAELKTAGVRA
jgi:ketosteroid isomerase-like protein